MKKFLQHAGAAFATLLGAALSVHAAAAERTLPPEQRAGIASYVSGGVGEGEAKRFEAAAAHYPLVVQLFESSGKRDEYTADAVVKISDAKGKVVLDRQADGPFMLVRLPAGEYRVGASLNGRHLSEHVIHVTEHGHVRTSFVFPGLTG